MSESAGVRELEVDLRNEGHQDVARRLLKGLCEQIGEGPSIAVAVLMVVLALASVLHAETPSPQRNRFAVRRILKDLVRNVRAHEGAVDDEIELRAIVH